MPVVAAVVERVRRDGATSVFLVQGRGWPKHWFGLVTGFLEKGEKAATGAVREVKEELGLDVEMVQPLGVFDFLRYNQVDSRDTTIWRIMCVQVILAYHVRLVNEADTVTLDQSELQDYKEVPIESVEVFPGPTGEALGEYLRRKGQKSRL